MVQSTVVMCKPERTVCEMSGKREMETHKGEHIPPAKVRHAPCKKLAFPGNHNSLSISLSLSLALSLSLSRSFSNVLDGLSPFYKSLFNDELFFAPLLNN